MNFFSMKNNISTKLLTFIIGILLLFQCKEPASLNALIVSDSADDINGLLKVVLENTELFDLSRDPQLLKNIADTNPETVGSMRALLHENLRESR